MTGRDLVIYIMENNLENERINIDILFSKMLLSESELASKFNVGVETVRAWYSLKTVPGIKIGDRLYFHRNTQDPRGSFARKG